MQITDILKYEGVGESGGFNLLKQSRKTFQGPSSFCFHLVSRLTYHHIPSSIHPQMTLCYMHLFEHNMALET